MKPQRDEPTVDEGAAIGVRWSAHAEDGSPEGQAGALLRQALQRDPIEAARLAAIRSRLRRDIHKPRRHWALRLAIAVVLILSGGALTTAGQRYFHLFLPGKPPAVGTPAPAPARAQHVRHGARSPALAPSTTEASAVVPAASPVPAVAAAKPVEERPPSPPAPPRVEPAGLTPAPFVAPEAKVSALAHESKVLTDALRKLRQEDDPRGALALLDEHDARFANGPLAPEATLARIEALLRTHRNGDALALLDRGPPSPAGNSRDLRIARAELRAAAGRCGDAAADFDLLLRPDRPLDAITERALWGRASCRAAGDGAAARSDLEDYLTSFPGGRFAAEARAALGK